MGIPKSSKYKIRQEKHQILIFINLLYNYYSGDKVVCE